MNCTKDKKITKNDNKQKKKKKKECDEQEDK
jgi:hypothetical protein